MTIKTPVSRVGNKTAILHILYALFPLKYGRFIDVFGGSGSVLLGKPYQDSFEVYNDFDRNLVNLFRCMKTRTMATIRELGFCTLNSREDFNAIRKFFLDEKFTDSYLNEELLLTELTFPPPEAAELKAIRQRITEDYDVRRAAMFLKLLRYSYSSGGKSYASQPFDIRRLFDLIGELERRMGNVIIENQDFETLIRHYDRTDAFFYLDPPYFSTEDMLYCRRKEEDEMNKADERILLEQITEAIRNTGYNPKMQIRGYLAECNDSYITRKGNARELIKTISTETLREYLKTE